MDSEDFIASDINIAQCDSRLMEESDAETEAQCIKWIAKERRATYVGTRRQSDSEVAGRYDYENSAAGATIHTREVYEYASKIIESRQSQQCH
jgi:hypothetical protein